MMMKDWGAALYKEDGDAIKSQKYEAIAAIEKEK
jgi:hypothetical protein